MTSIMTCRPVLLSALCCAILAGCKGTSPAQRTPVDLLVGANAAAVGATSVASGHLTIDFVRLAVSEASLGRGLQFGCIDCQGESATAAVPASILMVPLGGAPVLVATEQASPGTYTDAEIAVAPPGADVLRSVSDWTSGATIEVSGRFNGRAFHLPLAISGRFVEHLSSPVVVTGSSVAGEPVGVTVSLPVTSWFMLNGTALDPTNAAERAAIESNARRSFLPLTETAGEKEG
ncbi:MAG: hypothetical protein ABI910_20865 [Gemmatimonadota bacterium]